MKCKIDADTFAKAIKAVSMAASKDETRPHLHAVKLECEATTLRILATNGHWLAKYEATIAKVGDIDTGECLISLSDIVRVCAMLKGKVLGDVVVTYSDGKATFAYGGTSVACNVVDASFPPWRQVWPSALGKALSWIGIASEYMAVIAKAIATFDKRAPVTLQFGGELDPIVVTSCSRAASAFSAILMPCRVDTPKNVTPVEQAAE